MDPTQLPEIPTKFAIPNPDAYINKRGAEKAFGRFMGSVGKFEDTTLRNTERAL